MGGTDGDAPVELPTTGYELGEDGVTRVGHVVAAPIHISHGELDEADQADD